jgi:hypothetical protein
MAKLERVRDLDVPLDLFDHLGPKVLQAYRNASRLKPHMNSVGTRKRCA